MKNLLLLIVFATIISSCKKDDSAPANNFINTKWTAPDDIAKLIYGGTCTASIEFVSDTKCQFITQRVGGILGNINVSQQYNYTFSADSVFCDKWKAKVSGSIMVSNIKTIAGGQRTYIKE